MSLRTGVYTDAVASVVGGAVTGNPFGGLLGGATSVLGGGQQADGGADWCTRYGQGGQGGDIFDVEECQKCTEGAKTYSVSGCQARRIAVFSGMTGLPAGEWTDPRAPINQAMVAFQAAHGRSYSQIKELAKWVQESGWTPAGTQEPNPRPSPEPSPEPSPSPAPQPSLIAGLPTWLIILIVIVALFLIWYLFGHK